MYKYLKLLLYFSIKLAKVIYMNAEKLNMKIEKLTGFRIVRRNELYEGYESFQIGYCVHIFNMFKLKLGIYPFYKQIIGIWINYNPFRYTVISGYGQIFGIWFENTNIDIYLKLNIQRRHN